MMRSNSIHALSAGLSSVGRVSIRTQPLLIWMTCEVGDFGGYVGMANDELNDAADFEWRPLDLVEGLTPLSQCPGLRSRQKRERIA